MGHRPSHFGRLCSIASCLTVGSRSRPSCITSTAAWRCMCACLRVTQSCRATMSKNSTQELRVGIDQTIRRWHSALQFKRARGVRCPVALQLHEVWRSCQSGAKLVRGDVRGEAQRVASGWNGGSLRSQADKTRENVTPDAPTHVTLTAKALACCEFGLLEASVASLFRTVNVRHTVLRLASVIRLDLASVVVYHVRDAPIDIQKPLIRCGRCRSSMVRFRGLVRRN